MTKVLVIYASDYGHTRLAADAVARGAESIDGTAVRSRSAVDIGQEDVLDADALILGTPVHMGSVHWEMKRFIDESLSGLWHRDAIAGRVGGVFATGGGLGNAGGGCEFAMLSMMAVLAQLGLIIVPLPRSTSGFADAGHHWGPYARCGSQSGNQTPLPNRCLPALTSHGANIALAASAVASCPTRSIFTPAQSDPLERTSS